MLILINHGQAAQTVALPSVMASVLDGSRQTDSVTLAPEGVAVMETKR